MKLSQLMSIKAVITLIFGIGFVLVPKAVMALYGVTLDSAGAMMTQFFGAAFLLLSIVLWFARNAPYSEVTLRALLLAVVIGDAIGFIVALLAQLSGLPNALGWLNVVLYLLLTLGFGYFRFVKKAAS
jgi:NAD/NADP transhydrogenase beta subunit